MREMWKKLLKFVAGEIWINRHERVSKYFFREKKKCIKKRIWQRHWPNDDVRLYLVNNDNDGDKSPWGFMA
jgi:hypothetical protein